MTDQILRNKKAFTLVELLVAFAAIGTLLYGALHAIIKAEQLRTLAVERNTATVHANSVLQHLQGIAITFNGKRIFLDETLAKARYLLKNGRPIDIDEPSQPGGPTIYERYIGVKKEDALKNESVAICFPSWVSQIEPSDSGFGYCKIYIKWQSGVPKGAVVDQTIPLDPSDPNYDETIDGPEGIANRTNQMVLLDGYLRFTHAGY